jgi:CRP/FNR family transcriptional regulator, cyclic AMP receptor protein
MLQRSETSIDAPSVGYLRSIPLFGGVSEASCAMLCADSQALRVPDGSTVYSEGDAADALYVVWQGMVALHRDTTQGRAIVNQLGAGEYFGDQEFLDMLPRHLTVVGKGETTLWRIRYSAIDQLRRANLKEFSIFTLNAARQMSRRLRQTDSDLIELRAGRAR